MLWNEQWQFIYGASHKYLYSVHSLKHLNYSMDFGQHTWEEISRSSPPVKTSLRHKPHMPSRVTCHVCTTPHSHHGKATSQPHFLPQDHDFLRGLSSVVMVGSSLLQSLQPFWLCRCFARVWFQQGGPGLNTSSCFISVFKTHFYNQHSVPKGESLTLNRGIINIFGINKKSDQIKPFHVHWIQLIVLVLEMFSLVYAKSAYIFLMVYSFQLWPLTHIQRTEIVTHQAPVLRRSTDTSDCPALCTLSSLNWIMEILVEDTWSNSSAGLCTNYCHRKERANIWRSH